MNDEDKKKNFREISDALVLPLWTREHCLSGSYERHFVGYSDDARNPMAYLYGEGDAVELNLTFDPETCQKGRFVFAAIFPDDCPVVDRAKVTTGLSERIKETPYEFEAEEHEVAVSGEFTRGNIEEVKATILFVDDAVRALYK